MAEREGKDRHCFFSSSFTHSHWGLHRRLVLRCVALLGSTQDNSTALEYFEKAARKASAVGQNHLATMYLHGIEVDKDPKKAFQVSPSVCRLRVELPQAVVDCGWWWVVVVGGLRGF